MTSTDASAPRIVLTVSSGVIFSDDVQEGLNELAELLRGESPEIEISRPDPMRRYGAIFGEVVLIYIAMKVADNLTDRAIDDLLDRLLDPLKDWAKKRVQDRIDRGNKNIKGTIVTVHDETGRQVGPTIRATGEAGGEVQLDIVEIKDSGAVARPPLRPEKGVIEPDGTSDS